MVVPWDYFFYMRWWPGETGGHVGHVQEGRSDITVFAEANRLGFALECFVDRQEEEAFDAWHGESHVADFAYDSADCFN
jgi:hypothetical protein